ncbi:unnamed protein product [Closterium sp. NIES-53]
MPPPLFHGCTVPQLPTFSASLATTATDETAVVVTTSARSRVRSGRRGGQGGASTGGGGGGVASGDGGRSIGDHQWTSDTPPHWDAPSAHTRIRTRDLRSDTIWWRRRSGSSGTCGAASCMCWGGGLVPGSAAAAVAATALSAPTAAAGAAAGSAARVRTASACLAQLTDRLRAAYGAEGLAPDCLPLFLSHSPALWDMSASQLLQLLGTANAMYIVADSCASDSVCSRVFSLGASVDPVPVASAGVCVGASPGAFLADASLSFTLDSRASHCLFRDHTTLTPLHALVSVALADPTSRLVIARHSTTLPCPAFPLGSLTGLHISSFSKNLVGVRSPVSQHVCVWFEPSEDSVTYVDGDTYAPLATFCQEPGSGLYTLHTAPRERQQQQQQQQQMLPPTPVTAPRQVRAPPASLASLPPSLAPSCGPCVEGRLRATPHSSSLRPATEPFETLHLDSWTLPESPQQNGVAERRIDLVIEIAHTSMIHAHAPHFLWPYAVRVVSRFRVWGCLARVRDTSADKLSPRALPCVFLGFSEDSSDFTFYHPPLHRSPGSSSPSLLDFHSPSCSSGTTPPHPPPPGPAPSGPGAGGAGVGSEPMSAGGSSLQGAGVPVNGGAMTGGVGAPSAGHGEPGTGRVAAGGPGSGGGATGALDSTREASVGAAAAGAIAARGAAAASAAGAASTAAAAAAAAAATGGAAAAAAAIATTAATAAAAAGAAAVAAAAATPGAAAAAVDAYTSCLWPLGPLSPLPFSSLLPLSSCLRSHVLSS